MSRTLYLAFFFLFIHVIAQAQKPACTATEQCGTMVRLEGLFKKDASLKARFDKQTAVLTRAAVLRKAATAEGRQLRLAATIPVVVHVVLPNPAVVTDAQIIAQLQVLNANFGGYNSDSTRIPAYFKSLYGKSEIQFCLAQQTPDGDITNGINRVTTNRSSFTTDDAVKSATTGGINSWDTEQYFNIWITTLSDGVLGYASFPTDGVPAAQGVVIDYRSLPGGSFPSYNTGKSLVHETGHFFYLFHIWGDDEGACSGTDFVDDTPNQAASTNTCPTGIRTDACATSGNGVLYQNFMDYSPDACMLLFTPGQFARMEAAITTYHSSLLLSNRCQPPVLYNYDAQLTGISQPPQRICSPAFTPVVTLRNRGLQTLSAAQITVLIDGIAAATYNWSGALATSAVAQVTLPSVTVTEGAHVITTYVANPNARADEQRTNDTVRTAFQYYAPVEAVSESFENVTNLPVRWDVVNNDQGATWERVLGPAKTGAASIRIANFDYEAVGQQDDLRLPTVALPATLDSVFFSFEVAAGAYTALNTPNNPWDTLEVLISTDCGATYTSLYKKWGSTLVTRTTPTTSAFVPAASEWRKDSINLGAYIGQGNVLLTIRNTTGYENNIYLDDINLRTVTINPNLKAQGFLVTPNPTSSAIAVQFYPQPANLRAVQLYNMAGQKIAETLAGNAPSNYYSFNLSGQAAGVYIVRAVFSDRVVVRRIVKQ